jgi:hypothetical protein
MAVLMSVALAISPRTRRDLLLVYLHLIWLVPVEWTIMKTSLVGWLGKKGRRRCLNLNQLSSALFKLNGLLFLRAWAWAAVVAVIINQLKIARHNQLEAGLQLIYRVGEVRSAN